MLRDIVVRTVDRHLINQYTCYVIMFLQAVNCTRTE